MPSTPARRALGLAALLLLAACSAVDCSPPGDPEVAEPAPAVPETAEQAAAPSPAAQDATPSEPTASTAAPSAGAGADATARLAPDALVYRGAFRLPGPSGESNWGWAGDGMAYRPDGDPDGPDDGYPGSLFGFGHDHQHHVSEITIPAPVVSQAKNVAELPTAKTLQPFADVRGGHFTDYEIPRADLAYLPPQGEQTRPKLYFCFGQHMHETFKGPSHCWCEVDLAGPKTAGPWRIAGLEEYVTADYLFPLPPAWADAHTGGRRLATGRFRDGGQGSMGPALFAIAPWQHGNPPPEGTEVKAVTLLRYSSVYDPPDARHTVRDYHHSDEWAGAAWLTNGSRAAVVFTGTKGQGKCWYGFANGVVWPEEGPWPEVPPHPYDQRGWWSERFVRQMLMYDPADLAKVAAGTMKPHEPQPYAVVDLDPFLFSIKGKQDLYKVAACAADQQRGRLYVFERNAEEDDRALVHVWEIQ
jgi:hypothetical protein